MLQHRISGLPVTDANGAVVGIITEGDLLRRVETGSPPHHPDGLSCYWDRDGSRMNIRMRMRARLAKP
jgi:CBS-domain-containing membrane protein